MKDDNKKNAITKAVISLSNEIGFSDVSMSKIAKRAGVSSSTLYVYYENKDDMFNKVYADVKIQMHKECAKGLEMNETVENSVKKICKNVLRYIQEYTEEFLFIEQSCNSPFAKEGVLKQTSPILLISFCYYPIQQIFKEYRKPNSMLPDTDFNMVFQMCWDAIKR